MGGGFHRSAHIGSSVALLCAVLAVGLPPGAARAAEPTATSTDDWHDGIPPDGSFRVLGPVPFEALAGEPAESAPDEPVVQGVVAAQPGAFGGVVKYVARCVAQPNDRRKDADRIEAAVQFWKRQAAFAYQRDVHVGSLTGVEFQLADPGKTLRVRVLAAPRRTCTLFVQWNLAAKPREAIIDRFLGSFEQRTP